MVKKKGGSSTAPAEQKPKEEEIKEELPKVVEGHLQTEAAIAKCVEVCGPFRDVKQKRKRTSKAADAEKEEEKQDQPMSSKQSALLDQIHREKMELLTELQTVGMGQVLKLKRLLRMIEDLNDREFRASLSGPLARHELMSLLAEQALRLPLWVNELGEFPPPLVGAIGANDAYKLNPGDYCAAFVEDMWILGEVKEIGENGRYQVRDVDDAEKPISSLARRRVIPLPQYRADPQRDGHALFPKNTWILALYPQTTVFYKGIVEEPPAGPADPYKVAFDDATFAGGFSPPLEVPQRYVLAFREVHYKPRDKLNDRELTKEEIKEIKEQERLRKREEEKEQRRLQKEERKKEKLREKEKQKEEEREEKRKAREIRRKEKKKEKNRRAKERRKERKREEKEKAGVEGEEEKKEKEEEEEVKEEVEDEEREEEESGEENEVEDEEKEEEEEEGEEGEEEEEGEEGEEEGGEEEREGEVEGEDIDESQFSEDE